MCCIVEPATDKIVPLPLHDAIALVEQMAHSEAWRKIDAMELEMEAHPEAFFELPTEHTFYPGLYKRGVLMTAGRFITTRIHLTDHPFSVLSGRLLVWDDANGVVEISAPYDGSTKAGTRRLLYILEDTHWITYHANPDNETDPNKIVERCTYNNRLLREKMEKSP